MAQGVSNFSGTFGSHYQLVIELNELSVDIPNNRSLVQGNLYITFDGSADWVSTFNNPWNASGPYGTPSGEWTKNFDGVGSGIAVWLIENWQGYVSHNSDGTGSVSASAAVPVDCYSPYLDTASVSVTLNMTDIQRYSTPTSFYANNITTTGFTLNGTTNETWGNIGFSTDGGSTYPESAQSDSWSFTYTGLNAGETYSCYMYGYDPYSGYYSYTSVLDVTTLSSGMAGAMEI